MNLKLFAVVFISLLIPTLLWNHELFLLINGFNSPLFDHILGLWTGFGDGLVITVLVLMVMLFQLRLGLSTAIALVVASLITQILKWALEFPRPPTVFENIHLLAHNLHNYSFPSGHSTTYGVMALLALYLWRKGWGAWAAFVFFIIASYGRIYGGVHFPLDVVVGFAIGMATMYWLEKKSKLWPIERWQTSEWSWKIPGVLLMITAVVLGTGYEVKPHSAQILSLILPIAALFVLSFAWKKRLN